MIYEYHQFNDEPHPYQYSRTYAQFEQDLKRLRRGDVIRMDDGWSGQFEACRIARRHGVRVVLGIVPGYVDGIVTPMVTDENVLPVYMTWEQLRQLSPHHELANHTYAHQHLNGLSTEMILNDLVKANMRIDEMTGVMPTSYLPTFNHVSHEIQQACKELYLKILDPVVIMYNTTP